MKHYSAERKEAVLRKLAPPMKRTVPEVAEAEAFVRPEYRAMLRAHSQPDELLVALKVARPEADSNPPGPGNHRFIYPVPDGSPGSGHVVDRSPKRGMSGLALVRASVCQASRVTLQA